MLLEKQVEKLLSTLEILVIYNVWRGGEDDAEIPDPKAIGLALEHAIEVLFEKGHDLQFALRLQANESELEGSILASVELSALASETSKKLTKIRARIEASKRENA